MSDSANGFIVHKSILPNACKFESLDKRAGLTRRFAITIRNLARILDYCDEVTVLDNTTEFTAVAQWRQGILSWVGDLKRKAPWLLNALMDEGWRES